MLEFSQNKTLFGWNETAGITALELAGDNAIQVFRRVGGRTVSELQTFRPFLWLADSDALRDFKSPFRIEPRTGNLTYRYLATFESWKDINAAKKYLSKARKSAGFLFPGDPIHLHLLATGQTSFRELSMVDLHRLQIDVETYCTPGYEFPKAEREGDRIIAIALSDSTGWEMIL